MTFRPAFLIAVCMLMGLATRADARLTAADLLLIANRNSADSIALAKHYAQARGVPESRILLLDVPFAEKYPHAGYEQKIAAPVRAFLTTPEGRSVRCLVLFYGVPFYVGATESTPADREEVAMLRRLLNELDARTPAAAEAIEAVAKELGLQVPATQPGQAGIVSARARAAAAEQVIQKHLQSLPQDRLRPLVGRMTQLQTTVFGIATTALEVAASSPSATAPAKDENTAASQRRQLRQAIAEQKGPFVLYQLAEQQVIQLSTEESDASVDSELAMVLRQGAPRFKWLPNPLQNQVQAGPGTALMVARIDGPTPEIARRIIDDAVKTEAAGLEGQAAFDSRGMGAKKQDGYAWFDEDIRTAARSVAEHTKVPVLHDDRPGLINPHAAKDVALYCGWYSVRQYIPSCDFVSGAVAYHVASFEMISLRTPNEKGWVANLLRDNVCATIGPVSEPYLQAFPKPSEFFPLLLTGQLTLAECYWATIPMTSWKMVLIGDPLYRPYAAKPAMEVTRLSPALQQLVQKIGETGRNGR